MNNFIKSILFATLLIPSVSSASPLGWFLLGSVLTKKTTVVRDEFTTTIDSIKAQIPSRGSQRSLQESFYVTTTDPKVAEYFKNEGYKVSYQENVLSFDFKSEYAATMLRQEESIKERHAFMAKVKTFFFYAFICYMIVAVPIAFFKTRKISRKLLSPMISKKSIVYPALFKIGLVE